MQFYKWHRDHRLAHAYLATGDHAQDLRRFAKAALGSLLCEQPLDGEACGTCRSCLQLASGNHPEVEWLAPDGSSLKVQQMRVAIKSDTLRVGANAIHIVVMEDVHKLTAEAANSILKWVEEPGPRRLFLLLTTSSAALLPTLRSRVMMLRVTEDRESVSVIDQEMAVFSLEDKTKLQELHELAREFGDTAFRGGRDGWLLVAEKWSKWNFNSLQSLAFVDLVIRQLHSQAIEARDPATIHRMSELASAAFGVRRQMQSHVNAQLAWEIFFINAAKRSEGLGR